MKNTLPIEKAHRLIAPRIAYIITTVDTEGRVNAAVFSNLTSVSIDPQRLVIGVYKPWDTILNLRKTREFVVNVPNKKLLEQVWICGDKYAGNPIPPGINELKIAGLTELPSEKVKPPRVAECYGHLECTVEWIKDVGDHCLILGNIITASFTEGYMDENFVIDVAKCKPLMEISRNMFTSPSAVIRANRKRVREKVKRELDRMKVKIPKKLKIYQKNVLSEE